MALCAGILGSVWPNLAPAGEAKGKRRGDQGAETPLEGQPHTVRAFALPSGSSAGTSMTPHQHTYLEVLAQEVICWRVDGLYRQCLNAEGPGMAKPPRGTKQMLRCDGVAPTLKSDPYRKSCTPIYTLLHRTPTLCKWHDPNTNDASTFHDHTPG